MYCVCASLCTYRWLVEDQGGKRYRSALRHYFDSIFSSLLDCFVSPDRLLGVPKSVFESKLQSHETQKEKKTGEKTGNKLEPQMYSNSSQEMS